MNFQIGRRVLDDLIARHRSPSSLTLTSLRRLWDRLIRPCSFRIASDPQIDFGEAVAKVCRTLRADIAVLEVFLEVWDVYDLALTESGIGFGGREEAGVLVGTVTYL